MQVDELHSRIELNGQREGVYVIVDAQLQTRVFASAAMNSSELKALLAKYYPRYRHLLGGGRIHISHDEKQVRIFGSNPEYGAEADRASTVELIKQVLPDYDICLAEA